MTTRTHIRQAVHPDHYRTLDTAALRAHFLIESLFQPDSLCLYYLMYDRMITGGAAPVSKPVALTAPDVLKASYFLERREIGIINAGGKGTILADGQTFTLNHQDALYLGKGTREVVFLPGEASAPPLYYFNSSPAHRPCPAALVTGAQAETLQLGAPEYANERTVKKLLAGGAAETCQLQMGLTLLKPGSVWNTMPPHTHNRRMEVYFYFNLAPQQVVAHFMGEPEETRVLWIHNHQAAISPPWSVHAGAGTAHYAFIWGMCGENLDYTDMDTLSLTNLK